MRALQNRMLALVGLVMMAVGGTTIASPPDQPSEVRTNIVAANVSHARALYTVWYKRPGRRWTGVSGLSYYHATQVRDRYLAKGWDAYLERQ